MRKRWRGGAEVVQKSVSCRESASQSRIETTGKKCNAPRLEDTLQRRCRTGSPGESVNTEGVLETGKSVKEKRTLG
jgi:hypothetical protein